MNKVGGILEEILRYFKKDIHLQCHVNNNMSFRGTEEDPPFDSEQVLKS